MARQSLDQNQLLKQTQTLSPLQIRYFKMLEMNETQAEDEVNRALEENPALEVAPDAADTQTTPDDEGFNETAEELQMADYAREDDIPPFQNNGRRDEERWEPEAVSGSPSLTELIETQARERNLSPQMLTAVRFVAGNLDDNGYQTRTAAEMAADMSVITGTDIPDSLIEEALTIVRSLDPAGIGAADLRDCLLLQIKRRPRSTDTVMAEEIIRDYFDLFSHKHYDRLASALGVDRDGLRGAIDVIRSLNPKPGSEAAGTDQSDQLRQITPDFIVEPDDFGGLTITTTGRIPELIVAPSYETEATSKITSSRERAFIRRQRDEAAGFIDIVNLRHRTLLDVMRAIVSRQHNFFMTGEESTLKPMILRDISESTGYDASVISRSTSGKYVLTPWGIFTLKFFFNERFNDSDDTSSREIAAAIRSIIDGEDTSSPLTDDAVVSLLHERGYEVARRTVAKYRLQLGIPIARLRRQL